MLLFEGSLEVKLPTIWTNGKAEVGRVREEKSRREKSQKKEDAGARNGRKSRETLYFSTDLKAAGAKPSGQMRDEKLHAAVARSTFGSQNVHKTPHVRTTFGS